MMMRASISPAAPSELNRNAKPAMKASAARTAKLKEGSAEINAGRITLSRLFSLYLQHRSPKKKKSEQQADERRTKLWTRWLGADKDPHRITLNEWESFADARRSGSIDARGRHVAESDRKTVRDRTVEADLIWLKLVLSWGAKWKDRAGRYLLRENPVRGYELLSERNVRRPIATQDRFETVRGVSDQIMMEIRWDGTRRQARSYLSELLDIVDGTGRRISAVCALRYDDLKLEREPFGAIRWRADADKTGRETTVVIAEQVRRALDRVMSERPGVGAAPLFPSPSDPSKPVSRWLASEWLRKAEVLAELPKQEGGLWHPYRRKWATERKHLPDVDVAAAGGWAELESLRTAYQQADEATMLRVVLEPGELRERHA
jgi:hypothetical protein